MAKRDVVVIGASAGGVEALRDLVSQLPADFPASVLVVLHVPATTPSALPDILTRVGQLPARHATEEDALPHGAILVAPPDRHLIARRDGVTLSHGPRENGHRPAVDVLFRSAARTFGARVIAVVLSGALDDGAAGMVAVTLRGGVGIAQDPKEALHPSMPRAAAAAAGLEHVLPVDEIARLLVDLVNDDAEPEPLPSELIEMEVDVADMELGALTDPHRPGESSGWTCPDCHGVLFEIDEAGFTRFRCRVGHAWSADSLVAQQTTSLETALWVALRTLEERVTLALELGRRAKDRGHSLTGAQFQRQADEAQRSAGILRALIENVTGPADAQPRAAEST